MDYFKTKLLEEANEVTATQEAEALIEELADVLEVIHGFEAIGIDFEAIENTRLKKHKAKGSFRKGIVVDTVRVDENHELATYYAAHPNKYLLVAIE